MEIGIFFRHLFGNLDMFNLCLALVTIDFVRICNVVHVFKDKNNELLTILHGRRLSILAVQEIHDQEALQKVGYLYFDKIVYLSLRHKRFIYNMYFMLIKMEIPSVYCSRL